MQTLQMHNTLAIDVAELSVSLAPAEPITPEKTNAWADAAKLVVITDQATYNYAVELLSGAKALLAEAEAHHRPMISKAYAAHRESCDMLNRVNKPIEEAERIIKSKIGAWEMVQIRAQQESARQARVEAARIAAEEAEAQIVAAEEAGATVEEVKEIIREAEARPIIVPRAAPVFMRDNRARVTPTVEPSVTSLKLFVDYVAANNQYLSLLNVDMSALGKVVKALGTNFRMPGITLTEGVSVAGSSRGRK